MDWTAEAIDRLRELWAEGHSTAEIGRRMGITKNAVVGKAHRLVLSARPSPIRREAEDGSAARPVPAFRRAPAMPDAVVPPAPGPRRPAADPSPPAPAQSAARPASSSATMTSVPLLVARPFPRGGNVQRSCCWPLGDPGTAEFRFCTGEATTGKPYCAEHAAVAYVKVRDRREDAA